MKRNTMKKMSAGVFVFGMMALCVGAMKSYGAETSVCASGVAEPPFLSYGVDPNVLLMIDNSGSMYDPAYIDTDTQCYDDTYDLTGATQYAGYFESEIWYSYELATNKFTKLSAAPASCATGDYYGQDTNGKYVCVDLNTVPTPDTVVAFAAKGNFLNWAATSKFDIQKKILTGGKYDDTNKLMMLESRGCAGRRFVKQVTLAQVSGGTAYKLALGVRGPMEVYDAWRPSTAYVMGNIVQYSGILYKAKASFTSAADFNAANWDVYKDTRWYPGYSYPAGASVYNVASDSWFWTESGGVSSATPPLADDTSDMWEPYNGTEIEIFNIEVGGFDVSACQDAIAELNSDSPNLGQVKAYTDECMGYENGSPNSEEGAKQSALNHSLQECWYYNKHGDWQPGAGTVTSLKNDCESLYAWLNPADISPWDSGYVCYGSYTPAATSANGYIGRCWEPAASPDPLVCVPQGCGTHGLNTKWEEGSGSTKAVFGCRETDAVHVGGELYKCSKTNLNQCDIATASLWALQQSCTGGGSGAEAGWTDDAGDGGYACVDQALKDFCGIINVPEVIDPSDSTSITGETWNAPAMLVDSGIMGQLDKPLAIMKVRIAEDVTPEGLIQKYADDMRIGAMRFNDNGAKTECADNAATASSSIRYDCPDTNRDGAKVISEIAKDSSHTADLVAAINGIEANSWTPLSEAMFTAIGYYTQNDQFKCQAVAPNDFTVGIDPVQYWCQNNHIILITDGSSTADRNQLMKNAIATPIRDNDDAIDDLAVYNDGLYGSPYLDNFTYHAAQASAASLYPAGKSQLSAGDGVMKDKQNIKTHIVVSGSLRDLGETEYSPDVILPEAAENAKLNPSETAPLYVSENYNDLATNLEQVFSEIRSGASAGSAASVISSSRGGEGSVYQAIFWPSKPSSDTSSEAAVSWAGEVHALFIDTNGHLYEDTDGDRQLTNSDKRVVIYFDSTALVSKGCYAALNNDGTCNAASQVSLDEVRYLWSANDWLAKISNIAFTSPAFDNNDQKLNRDTYISDKRRRYIFTWNDLDNAGDVDAGELFPFVEKNTIGAKWSDLAVHATRRAVTNDFNLTDKFGTDVTKDNAEVNNIVNWVRGVELTDVDSLGKPKYRSRTIAKKMNVSGSFVDKNVVWRLGDVVHSTPTAVARPMEGLHLIYGDTSYGKFVDRWENRRHMAYFGANDGMLHGVNAGFYNEGLKKFCLTADCSNENGVPELGAEMWAYVPYNLLPHLKCLTSPNYVHKYYVDQRPRVFDAKIFTAEAVCSTNVNAPGCIHPEGWGTVLVGAMRFGGARVEADRLSADTNSVTDNRYFTSSYFLLDITNPEAPPDLLGEFTMLEDAPYRTDLGFTTASPTPVVMKNKVTGANEWYLLMGSGPTAEDPSDGLGTLPIFDSLDAIKGKSDKKPKVAVYPLKRLTENPRKPFRIPSLAPTALEDAGVFTLGNSSNGFVSDMITVDYDTNPSYMSDAVYFGTVEHGADLTPNNDGDYNDDWDGKLYRIVTRKLDNTNNQIEVTPNEWDDLTPHDATGFTPLFNAQQPITAAPAVGTDRYNFWVYFGTGRFYDADDKADNAQQSFYGIKELTGCDGKFLWASNIDKAFVNTNPGHRGLVDVSNVFVDSTAATFTSAKLFCTPGDLADGALDDPSCLPENSVTTLGSLITYTAGSGTTHGSSCVDSNTDGSLDALTGTDGWYRDFPKATRPRERNVGQATLLGGLLTFTTYQPYDDLCQQEGQAYLYGLYYQTGTAWYKSVFGDKGLDGERVKESISLGRGLATTPNLHVGSGEGPTAFIQTSTGEIIELPQTNLPYSNFKSGRQSWLER